MARLEATDQLGRRLVGRDHRPGAARWAPDDRQRVRRILTLPPPTGPVLEIGCSDGALASRLARAWRVPVLGTDAAGSPAWRWRQRDRRLRFVQIRAGRLPGAIDPRRFRRVVIAETLEHLPPRELDSAMRVALAVGDLVVTVPNRYPAAHYVRAGRARWKWPTHVRHFTQPTLTVLLVSWFLRCIRFVPLYDGEPPGDSIFLIAHARRA